MSGKSIVSNLMGEYILCGGLLYTRASLYNELHAEGVTGPYGADWYAFGPRAISLSAEEVSAVRAYWGGVPEGFWNRTGEVPVLPLDWKPEDEEVSA